MNSTIVLNAARFGAGGIRSRVTNRPVITNCILWANGDDLVGCSATYSCIEDGDPGEGNISDDPLFVEFDKGDYHLLGDSPCIDAGDPNFEPLPGETDMDGQMRVWGGGVDMGADEFGSFVFGDINCDGAINAFDIEPFILALFDPAEYELQYPDCDINLADINGDGSVDALDIEPFLGLLFP